jgi:FixJ family two-component response regulator
MHLSAIRLAAGWTGQVHLMSETDAAVPTIAIIDDDEPVRVTMSSLVRSLGFNAIAFSSAEEYLLSPHQHLPACVISDVQMPGMSGLDLQDRLTAQDNHVPIIFITAFPHANIEKRARAGGAVCILNKPFQSEILVDCIQRALSSKRTD